jgi:Flp pilus assembly protein TadG
MDSIRNPNGSSRGQTLVEFALIAPVIFILLFGIIDFGMYLDHRITLQHAIREGARYAAVHATCEDLRSRTAEESHGIVDAAEVCVRYFDSDGTTPTNPAAAGDVVEVSAPLNYDVPLFDRFGLGDITVNVSGSARLEMAVTSAGGIGCGPCP